MVPYILIRPKRSTIASRLSEGTFWDQAGNKIFNYILRLPFTKFKMWVIESPQWLSTTQWFCNLIFKKKIKYDLFIITFQKLCLHNSILGTTVLLVLSVCGRTHWCLSSNSAGLWAEQGAIFKDVLDPIGLLCFFLYLFICRIF